MLTYWKDIKGYDGLYQISSEGQVMTMGRTVMTGKNLLRTYDSKVLSAGLTRGYYRVALCKNGSVKNFSVARLVGLHFVNGYFDGAVINHINGIKTDNRSVNLEWTTSKGNTRHAHENGLIKGFVRDEKYRQACSESKRGLKHPFSKIVLDQNAGVFYYSVFEAALAHNISRSTLNTWFKNPQLNRTPLVLV